MLLEQSTVITHEDTRTGLARQMVHSPNFPQSLAR